ncbi:hypothetical protein BDZ91DRAFT_845343 [Kalaharituber pfeilii]|nr:hypothetical protein BDZ91DRAFT_845343 [Kalaharituber pfeilii]
MILSLKWIGARLGGASAQQVRGAKKLARDPTITVQLLKDIPKFGRKGTIMPVARGRMRNLWFPQGLAKYLSYHDLKNINRGDIVTERDLSFIPETKDRKTSTVGLDILSPEISMRLLNALLPESIEFGRSTISENDTSLHGSITTADVASALRAMVAAGEGDVSRVVIKTEHITLMGMKGKQNEKMDKIQRLGTFKFEIKMEKKAISRKIVVSRQASVAGETVAQASSE